VGAGRKPASEHTAARNREALSALPPDDAPEQGEARRGCKPTPSSSSATAARTPPGATSS